LIEHEEIIATEGIFGSGIVSSFADGVVKTVFGR
jgi:hypothetical protein